MPSVIAYWSGQLRETSERDELSLRMVDLAQPSHSCFQPNPPQIKKYNQTIEGHILLSTHLFSSPPSTPKLTRIDENYFSLRDVSLLGLEFQLYDGRGLYSGDDRMSFVFCVDEDPQTLRDRFEREVASWTDISEAAVQFWQPLRERQRDAY